MVRKNRSEDVDFEKRFLAYCQEEEENRQEKKINVQSENNISCLDDLDEDDSSAGEGVAENNIRRCNLQVPSVVNVTESFVGHYNFPSPELSVASRSRSSSTSVSKPVRSIQNDGGSGHGLYGKFGVTEESIHNRASV